MYVEKKICDCDGTVIMYHENIRRIKRRLVLVEQRTGNAEVTGSNPVEALIFFRLLRSNRLNWKIYCDDHSSLSSITAVQK